MHWTEMHAGHYFHALAHPALRFHENNVKPQCPVCNTTLAGNLNVYKQKLIFELGEDGFSAMELMSLKSAKHRNLAEKVKTWQTEINERQNNIDNLSGS